MFLENLGGDNVYVHAKPKDCMKDRANPAWRDEIKMVDDYDIGKKQEKRRFYDHRIGAKYFSDSKETCRAEVSRHFELRMGRPMVDFSEHAVFVLQLRPEAEVFSMLLAENDPVGFLEQFGVTIEQCYDKLDYGASQEMARQLPREARGVKYASVARDGGRCLAAYYPNDDVVDCTSVEDL